MKNYSLKTLVAISEFYIQNSGALYQNKPKAVEALGTLLETLDRDTFIHLYEMCVKRHMTTPHEIAWRLHEMAAAEKGLRILQLADAKMQTVGVA